MDGRTALVIGHLETKDIEIVHAGTESLNNTHGARTTGRALLKVDLKGKTNPTHGADVRDHDHGQWNGSATHPTNEGEWNNERLSSSFSYTPHNHNKACLTTVLN